jgi:hypothetical protein
MNFMHISNRIEICFWQLVVAVLKGQRLRLFTVLLLPMLGLSMAFITTASLSAFQDEVVSEIWSAWWWSIRCTTSLCCHACYLCW